MLNVNNRQDHNQKNYSGLLLSIVTIVAYIH